jgi:hypothetical protein
MNLDKFVASFRKFIWEECFKEQGNIFVLVLIGVNRHYAKMVYIVSSLGEGTLQHFSTKLSFTDSSKEYFQV